MTPEQFVEHLIKEWNTLKAAPIAFILLVLFAFGAAALVVTWLYSTTMQTLNQRLASKDDLLAEYRERLHLVPTDQTKFNKFTNRELRAKVFALVEAIRAFHNSAQDDSRKSTDSQMDEMRRAKSEEERTQIWNRYTQQHIDSFYANQQKYSGRFATEAILLRDELLTRLPPSVRDKTVNNWYDHPNYHWSSLHVTTDLERLAKLLPESSDK